MESAKKRIEPGQTTALRLLFALLIGAAGIASAFSSAAALIYPAFLVFIGAAWGMPSFFLAAGVSIIGTGLLTGAESAAYSAALYLPAASVLLYVIKFKKPNRYGVIAASACFAVALYANYCLPSLLAGEEAFAGMTALIISFKDMAAESLALLGQSEDSIKAYSQMLGSIAAMAPEITVYLIGMLAAGFGFFDFIIARALYKRCGGETAPMGSMCMWRVPKSFAWGSLILVIGSVIASLAGMKEGDAVLAACMSIAIWPFALMGICSFEFSMKMPVRRSGARRVIMCAALVLLLPYSIIGMALSGFLERLVNTRKRTLDRMNGKQE